MRSLKFIVDRQCILPDPNCDFEGLVPGTEKYLKAEFSFSKEWDGCVKVAEFKSVLGREFEPQILKDGISCVIPREATKFRRFLIGVHGKNKDGMKITTNYISVRQDGGN